MTETNAQYRTAIFDARMFAKNDQKNKQIDNIYENIEYSSILNDNNSNLSFTTSIPNPR